MSAQLISYLMNCPPLISIGRLSILFSIIYKDKFLQKMK